MIWFAPDTVSAHRDLRVVFLEMRTGSTREGLERLSGVRAQCRDGDRDARQADERAKV